jgi:hypothetical protein
MFFKDIIERTAIIFSIIFCLIAMWMIIELPYLLKKSGDQIRSLF